VRGDGETVGFGLLHRSLTPWISLFFIGGPGLGDSNGLLKGSGSRVRRIALAMPDDLIHPDVVSLMDQALALTPIGSAQAGYLIIQSI